MFLNLKSKFESNIYKFYKFTMFSIVLWRIFSNILIKWFFKFKDIIKFNQMFKI